MWSPVNGAWRVAQRGMKAGERGGNLLVPEWTEAGIGLELSARL
ncbi:MAG: hypothetical protein WA324_27510 [Bryobacteraceae bacterium]